MNLTLIIPHYNSVDLLEKLLLSIPHRKEIEVIVIDDKSTVGREAYDVLREDTRFSAIDFLDNKTERKGAGVCRNIGLNKAMGKWVLFADADDYFTDTMYDGVCRYFNDDVDVIFFKPTSIFVDTGKESDRHIRFCERLEHYTKEKNLKNELELRYKLDVPWSKMINRSFLIQNRIVFEEVIASNDILFSAKVGFFMKKFLVSEETIYVATRSFGSLTGNRSEEVFHIRLGEKIKYYTFLKEKLSADHLSILNISFLDFLFKSTEYGLRKFVKVLYYLVKKRLPLYDARLLNPKTLSGLVKTMVQFKKKNKKYGHSSSKTKHTVK